MFLMHRVLDQYLPGDAFGLLLLERLWVFSTLSAFMCWLCTDLQTSPVYM